MSDDFRDALRAALPLVIGRALWSFPTLVVGGENWNLAATCPWRVSSDEGLDVASEFEDVQERLPGLIGRTVVGADVQSRFLAVDPCLLLDDGRRIELFSAHFLEPWTLRLPDSSLMWVAAPDDPAWLVTNPDVP
jgi:hypothetical protein